jgi:hypothetical protein
LVYSTTLRGGLLSRLALGLLGICFVIALAAPRASAELTHPFEKVITGAVNDRPYDRGICGLGVNPVTEDLLVLNPGYDAVDVLDPTTDTLVKRYSAADSPGTFESMYGGGPSCSFQHSLGINTFTGQVFVGDSTGGDVKVFDNLGNYERTITGGETPEREFGFNFINATVDRLTGDLYVSSYHYFQFDEGRIHRFTADGKYKSELKGTTGTYFPFRMSTDADGNLWAVAYLEGGGLQKFNSAGQQLLDIRSTPSGPLRQMPFVATSNDHAFTLESKERHFPGGSDTVATIREFDGAGNYVGESDAFDSPQGFIKTTPVGLAATDDGRIYVAYADQKPKPPPDQGNEAPGEIYVFGAGVVVPTVTTGPPTLLKKTSATVSGTIDPDSPTLAATCEVEYGTDLSFGQTAPCTPPNIPAGTSPVAVTAELTGLVPETSYSYRIVGENANGDNPGATRTLVAPTVLDLETKPATAVDRTSATLNGSLNPEGIETEFHFEYGTGSGSYEFETPVESAGSGVGATPVSASPSGLQPGTQYYFRLSATNAEGTTHGEELTFTTSPAVKAVATTPATGVGKTTGTLNGSLDPDGESTAFFFEYGASDAYGETIPAPPGDAGSAPGSTPVSSPVTGLQTGTEYHYRLAAVNTVGTTYGQDLTFTTTEAVKDVTTGPATDLTTTSATLSGSFDPEGQGTHYYFEYGTNGGLSQKVPAAPGVEVEPGTGTTPAQVAVTGLQAGATYEYRLVVTNADGTSRGEIETFTTAQLAGIEALNSSNLGETVADLNARIRTNGEDATYQFEYGPTPDLGTAIPDPAGAISDSPDAQEISVHLTGLESGQTYFFRLSVTNKWGTRTSGTQTFTFSPPVCPNALVRQQTRANYLPDCRAYELVTPENAGSILLGAAAPSSPEATNPARVAYNGSFGVVPGTGEPPNVFLDLYASTRTNQGWVNKYVGIPATKSLITGARTPERSTATVPTSDDMGLFMTMDNRGEFFCIPPPPPLPPDGCYEDLGDMGPHVYNANGEFVRRLPTTLFDSPGNEQYNPVNRERRPMQALSDDFNHFVFAWDGPPYAPGGVAGEPGSVYDNDVAADEVVVASKTPGGAPIPKEEESATLPFLGIRDVSEDGSHILISAPTFALPQSEDFPSGQGFLCFGSELDKECLQFPEHLYMRVDAGITYDVTRSGSAEFVGASDDGSKVIFKTDRQMTSEDEDGSVDLYRWEETGDTITLLSKGNSGSAGNVDNCGVSWTTDCDIRVAITNSAFENEALGNCQACRYDFYRANTDSPVSSLSGDVWFYSPEQLDGTKGVPGLMNLYATYEGGVRFVAALQPDAGYSKDLDRLQVSPDNSHAAFVTSSPITSFQTNEFKMMYSFDTGSDDLICVSCRPDGVPPTSDAQGSQSGRFIADDGRPFFSTGDPIVPQDTNNLIDVYEFVSGRPQLISNGTASRDEGFGGPAGLVGVNGNGTDVYFSIYDKLVEADQNGSQMRIYDARTNGGFLENPPAAPCDAADECHGVGSARPTTTPIITEASIGGGNHAKKKKAAKRKKAARRKAAARKHAKQRQRRAAHHARARR